MFSVHLKHFEKFKNSTARPDLSTDVTIKIGEIKGDFSPLAFDITFDLGEISEMPPWNYAWIFAWDKYYFITNWTFVGGLWTASFVEDVLATFAPDLYNSYQYLLRSADIDNSDLYIDTTYMQGGAAERMYVNVPAAEFWGSSINDGCVVCGCIGNSGNSIGAVTYYAMTYDAFNNFMGRFMNSISWANISADEISEDLQKALINPAQYIVSCHWLPISTSDISGTTVSSVRLGWWSFSLTGGYAAKRLSNRGTTVTKNFGFTRLSHPQGNQRGCGFVKFAPYSRYTLKFLPFGVFSLDTAAIANKPNIFCSVLINPMTGDAVLDISCGDNSNRKDSILTANANIGVQIPTGQVAANLGNIDNALLLGGIAGATDLISALNQSQRNIPGGTQGGTTVNASGYSHYSGSF